MSRNVNKVSVWCEVNIDFLGPVSINFEWVPDPNDPVDVELVNSLLAKNERLNLAAAKLAGTAEPFDFG